MICQGYTLVFELIMRVVISIAYALRRCILSKDSSQSPLSLRRAYPEGEMAEKSMCIIIPVIYIHKKGLI